MKQQPDGVFGKLVLFVLWCNGLANLCVSFLGLKVCENVLELLAIHAQESLLLTRANEVGRGLPATASNDQRRERSHKKKVKRGQENEHMEGRCGGGTCRERVGEKGVRQMGVIGTIWRLVLGTRHASAGDAQHVAGRAN